MFKLIFLGLLSVCLSLGAQATANNSSAVVLMYHHFGEDRYPSTNIRLEQFDQQIKYLQDNHFQVLPLNEIINTLKSGQALPDKTIAITIDDAYRSIYSEAYPRLKKLGWPFTVFVSTDYIDKEYSNYMTWEQMREMQAHGASYGNHSSSHDYLVRRHENESEADWQQRMLDDIKHAQQRLEKELSTTLKVIAYPYGEYDLALASIIHDLGLTGMGQHSGAISTNSDFRFLPRFPMAEAFAEMSAFKTKINSLAMPVKETPLIDPVTQTARPELNMTLEKELKQLACFASGQGAMTIEWLNKMQFRTQAEQPLAMGRSRYNCTAPSNQAGRYYWFSQPWLRLKTSPPVATPHRPTN